MRKLLITLALTIISSYCFCLMFNQQREIELREIYRSNSTNSEEDFVKQVSMSNIDLTNWKVYDVNAKHVLDSIIIKDSIVLVSNGYSLKSIQYSYRDWFTSCIWDALYKHDYMALQLIATHVYKGVQTNRIHIYKYEDIDNNIVHFEVHDDSNNNNNVD